MIILIIICFLIYGCQQDGIQRPNIVFIAVDDLRTDLGCYGNSMIKSPNLDKLASQGILFTNHFVNVPTCGASRQCLLTGMRPQTPAHLRNNIIEKTISNQAESENPETFIHHLRRNGYYTVGIGKISHSADGYVYGYTDERSAKKELPYSWDELLFNPGKWGTGWNAFFGYANGENRQSLKKQVKPYESAAVGDTGYVDGLSTQLAIDKLSELKDRKQPFFLGLGLFKPHLPFTAPEKYWNYYDRADIPISQNPLLPENVNLNSLHKMGEFNQYALGDEQATLEKPISDAYAQKLRHAYYACVSYVDAQIGLLMAQIDALALDNNTIIIVWGDHGWHLGDQQIWGKHTIFDNALKSTLIIKTPKNKNAKTVASIVETVDIYPSLLEMCDLHLPYPMDGESFNPIINGIDMSNTVAYSYWKNGISMRTDRYRLTKYYSDEEPSIELYDHKSDPLESINVVEGNDSIIEQLSPLLAKGNNGIYN